MEQSYKEKYEDILARLERAKNDNDVCDERYCCVIDEIIPELAESEDEQIRKWIINEIKIKHHNLDEENVDFVDKAIAWLERQGEHANFRNKIQVGDKVTRNEAGVLVNLSQLNRVAKPKENKGNIGGISPKWSVEDEENFCSVYLDVKSARQNTVNSLSGDLKEQEQKRMDEVISWLESLKGRVQPKQEWSEEDEPQKELAKSYLAKFDEKFPILPTLKGKQLADYKNFLNKCQQIFRLKYWGTRPIQAKLFEKLSLLWAAWGAEHLQGLGQTYGDMDDEILWSEEDEQRLNSCLNILQPKTFVGNTETINTKWLKSLKDRVQPKQEWGEEDEHRIKDTVYFLDTAKKHYASTEELDACIAWLESLKGRARPQWKPSDEQIAQLQIVIDTYGNEGICDPILTELLFQLKKLRGKV